MSSKNNTDNSLSLALKYDGMQGSGNLNDLHRIDREVEEIKSKLNECHIECEQTEKLICDVEQLKNKGTFVLKNTQREYSDLDGHLNEIHCNYVKCMKKTSCNDEILQRRINSLTLQRNSLKKELEDLKKIADGNNKKLIEIKKMIAIQEKKNMALAKKLKRMTRNIHIPVNIKDRVNVILQDPRITNVKNTMPSVN